MARGGYRSGAGRPRGASNVKVTKKEVKVIKQGAKLSNMTPLEYMLSIMNCDEVNDERRDKMAIAAAPYIHERAVDKKLGKKEQRVEDAKGATNMYSARRSTPKLAVDNT